MKLPPEWSEFIDLLFSHRVRFLVVGAHALAAIGRPRATVDLDLFVEATESNARRLAAALSFAAFFATWLFVEFQTPAVRIYIVACTLVTLVAALIPRDRVILAACATILIGFVIAGVLDVAGK